MRPLRMPRAPLPNAPEPVSGGLRERKKAQTRQHISDVATGLFLERGFDAVTVAEIAAVADVSVKTVFNYFGSKEDLLFDRQDEIAACIDAVAATRPPGEALAVALLRSVAERYPAVPWGDWDDLTAETVEQRRAFSRMVDNHPQLRAHMLSISERMAASIRTIIAADLGRSDHDPQVLAYARLVHAAYTATGVEYTRSLLADLPADEIRTRSVAAGTAALGLLTALPEPLLTPLPATHAPTAR